MVLLSMNKSLILPGLIEVEQKQSFQSMKRNNLLKLLLSAPKVLQFIVVSSACVISNLTKKPDVLLKVVARILKKKQKFKTNIELSISRAQELDREAL
jgi:hypothetical protein